ncbi:MAG: hypothetical protein LBV74_16835 [Tannerella sp.]|jgi:hypothetical protein|nr:hypothetical protein [Tannerella sp.]
MEKKSFIAWIAGLVIVLMTGCNDIDDYSVSPNHQLSFSTDTLSFDTVFTTIGSTTGYFMIYNRNDEALKIDKILLAGGGESGFRINIDGRKGSSFSEIPIWKKDSLYVAVEVTVNPNDDNTPFLIHDSIVFITNGRTQSVLLEAYGQNAYILRGGTTFANDTTLTAERPYLIYDSIMIPESVTVNIDKGASFYMHKNAKWLIDGTIKTNGTQNEPVIFRADRLNNFSSTISYDNISAQWDGLFFGASSFDNELNYTLIRNGISGLTFEESTPDRKKIDIRDSQITNMDGNVLWAVNCYIEASNTEFSNASDYLVMLSGGKYQFTHCTMANYMPSAMMSNSATRFIQALTLADNIIYVNENNSEEKHSFPLQQAFFDNCVIDGSLSADTTKKYGGEIMFSTNDIYINGDDGQFNYHFNHCVMKTKKVDNSRFNEVLFVENPKVESMKYIKSDGKNKDGNYDYVYDFRLANESLGIGKADRSISEQYPTDRYGVNRLTSEFGPSIGAYEYVSQEETKNEK